ncbi:cleavage and polyadenylation specificity factor subunit 7-like [Acipenser ruthenus]|uniref:cleavage and polyadenylation specificity factor subunit 7-like n=1 Tax=Acipenser ruthenus TaxID=7906 RepID=UPI00145A14E4|nr:cleavage and polyadenylation specificity factor subunit 7-like [Acipenser ruthenus]XP_058858285.1 cleavage and polyadenylation specificity factor subunit 7-like [Acipenser ruthenus]
MAAAAAPGEGPDLIDIYAEEEFNQGGAEDVGFAGGAEHVDLYDDVLTGPVGGREGGPPSSEKDEPPRSESKPAILYTYSGQRHKRLAVYVGNFSWWTTDVDLVNAAKSIGVKDIQEIKFAENRANGQSKGYAEVVVGSEPSLHSLLEFLPQRKVNGDRVEVRFATRQNFSVFETQAKKLGVSQRNPSKDSADFGDKPSCSSGETPPPSQPHADTPPSLHPFYSRPPFPGERPSSFPPPRLPPPHMHPPPGVPRFGAMPPPPPLHMPHFVPPPLHLSIPPPGSLPPTLHLNPAFFPQSHPAHSSMAPPPATAEHFNRAPPGHPYTRHRESDPPTPPLGEAEFEEIMHRNRAISSSAISKAVSWASGGDLAGAIETLLTAIAVIKQSRVSSDERCRVLLSALKDCLHSIEAKSYGSRKRPRSHSRTHSWDSARRHRERSHSGERHDEHHREGERNREGERDRHHQHRDRDRHR